MMTSPPTCSLEGELHNGRVAIGGRQVEHREDVLPARTNIASFAGHHLSYTAYYHVSYGDRTEGEGGEGRGGEGRG